MAKEFENFTKFGHTALGLLIWNYGYKDFLTTRYRK